MTESVWGADTIDANVRNLITACPVIWPYITGTTQNPEIEWEPADIALFPHSQVYRLDQGFGDQSNKARWFECDEFDLEAGAWTPPSLAPVIEARNGRRWSTRVYASGGPWAQLLDVLRAEVVSIRSLFWREANWSLSETEARNLVGTGGRYAIQWASPSSNPDTLIPGTSETLTSAGADLNVIALSSTMWRG